MKTHIIEATIGQSLWSSYMVGLFTTERDYISVVEGAPLLRKQDPGDLLVLDLFTREGAVFGPRGYAKEDIRKHAIWTSPLFEPFLDWLREQLEAGVAFDDLPHHVELKTATESQRHAGPLDNLLKLCLTSTDKDVAAEARAIWRATYGSPVQGVPPTLADLRQWAGDFPMLDL